MKKNLRRCKIIIKFARLSICNEYLTTCSYIYYYQENLKSNPI